jgi:UDP-N-acetylglucosamine 2-epimerase (non-hydrolysing)
MVSAIIAGAARREWRERHTQAMTAAVTHVVGARPNFIKAAPLVRELDQRGVDQRIIHTGQHYDDVLSGVFFRELGLPAPDVNLGVGSGSQASQTAAILVGLEAELLLEPPPILLLYGDVNSTLGGALVAAKLGIPIGHVEAGLRSFDRSMPEEINRVVVDALSDVLFTTSPEAGGNLSREGVDPARIHFVGNPMIDTLLRLRDRLDPRPLRARFRLADEYGVVTIHRPANVDDEAVARRVAAALAAVSELLPLVIPLHPRGHAALTTGGLGSSPFIQVVEPLGYIDFLSLVSGARLVITDSGGIQEETTVLGIPCLTLRPNTERPITISHGTNRLVAPESLLDAVADVVSTTALPTEQRSPSLWDGRAGNRIADIVEQWLTPGAAVTTDGLDSRHAVVSRIRAGRAPFPR